MSKKIFLFAIMFIVSGLLVSSSIAHAQLNPGDYSLQTPAAPASGGAESPAPGSSPNVNMRGQESAFLSTAGLTSSVSVSGIIANVITAVLGLLAVIFIILLIIAGFQWMTAEGDEEKINKAKQTISRAIIGLAIVIAAYSITYFVFNALSRAAVGGTHTVGGSL